MAEDTSEEIIVLPENKQKIAIALGSGSARGWAHIGVIKALVRHGIEPDIVCGTSIGALVGAAYAHNRLDDLEEWAINLSRWRLLRFLDVTFSRGAVVHAERVRKELSNVIADNVLIEDLSLPFATLATDMMNGREVRFLQGSLHDAILASTAIPGFLPPVYYRNRWLFDGGVVNPVPVNLCRHFEPDFVLAVNLNGNIIQRHFSAPKSSSSHVIESMSPPSMFDSFAKAINVMQDRITRSRMVGDPPDVLLTPKVSDIDMMDFDQAKRIIEAGEMAVEKQIKDIKSALYNDDEEIPVI